MKRILIFGLILSSLLLSAQNNISLDVMGGIDYSQLLPIDDSLKVEPRVSPYLGLGFNLPTQQGNEIQFGALYSMKASKDEMHAKYRSMGIGLFAKYQYKLSDIFWLNLGGQYTIPFKSYALLPVHTVYLNGAKEVKITAYEPYFSATAGIRLQLNQQLYFDLAYEYPFNNLYLTKFPNIRAGIAYRIDKNTFKFKDHTIEKKNSQKLIRQFRKTALLVRLPSYKRQIDQYREAGNTRMMNQLKQKRNQQNQALVQAFKSEFNFCQVYFFYTEDTEKVKSKQFQGIFVNNKLEKDPSIQFHQSEFLVGKLGYSIIRNNENVSYTDVYKNGFNIADGYTKSGVKDSDYSNYGFTMVNQDFKLIDKPFPSHTRGYFLFKKLDEKNIIKKLNERLYKFYQKSKQ